MPNNPRIGVLALQGAFAEHVKILRGLGADALEVRKPAQLDNLDGLVIPGGESTSMALIAERWGMVQPLREWVHGGQPTWGTCAGMILVADRATGQKQGGQTLIGGLDVTVDRNYFGRQVNSFVTDLDVSAFGTELGDVPFHGVFIRAPAVIEAGDGVETLAALPAVQRLIDDEDSGQTVAVAVRQGPILATAFHPELTNDHRFHELFLQMAQKIG